MRIFAIVVVIVIVFAFCFGVILMAVTNPSESDFMAWYERNVEKVCRDEIDRQIAEARNTGDDTLNLIVDGLYKVFLDETVDKQVDEYLKEIRKGIEVDRKLLLTKYSIRMPSGENMYVIGILNKFSEVTEEIYKYF